MAERVGYTSRLTPGARSLPSFSTWFDNLTLNGELVEPWRRGWDSNPRGPCGLTAFRVRRTSPLCDLSSNPNYTCLNEPSPEYSWAQGTDNRQPRLLVTKCSQPAPVFTFGLGKRSRLALAFPARLAAPRPQLPQASGARTVADGACAFETSTSGVDLSATAWTMRPV